MTAPSGGVGERVPVPTRDDIEAVVARILETEDGWYAPDAAFEFGEGLKWKPHLVRGDPPKQYAHVHLGDRLRPHLVERFHGVAGAGGQVFFYCEIDDLYDPDTVLTLSEVDAHVSVVRSDKAGEPAELLRTLADFSVVVGSEVRTALGQQGWERCQTETDRNRKGRRLESLLAFLLSQVNDFRLYEVNLNTETEELDVVVQQRNLDGTRCWSLLGAPFMFVEAKNWTDRVGQKEVTLLWGKMKGKRGTVRISILVGSSGFSDDARKQELRFAADEETILLMGPDELESWIASDSGDDYLENLISSAMLR